MEKMERLGCSKSVVGLVCRPATFNLDGTNIYMTLWRRLFIAQALNVPLTLGQELTILGGRDADLQGRLSGVTGAGFITLAATLAAVRSAPFPAWPSCSASTSS